MFCLLALIAPMTARAEQVGWAGIQQSMIDDCEDTANYMGGTCVDLTHQRGGWNNAAAMMIIALPPTSVYINGKKTKKYKMDFTWEIEVKSHACVDSRGRWTGDGYHVEDSYNGDWSTCPFALPKW